MNIKELVRRLDQMSINTGTLNCFGCGHEHNCGTRGCAVLRDAADRLEWRRAEYELPVDDSMMLVTCRTKKGALSVNRAYYSNGCWHGSGSMAGVIAWMPLPEPYEPNDDEQEE